MVLSLQAQFGPAQVFHNGSPDRLLATDLDGDGQPDLLCLFNGNQFKWFRNTDGLGTFASNPALPLVPGGVALFDVVDLNGDGLPDLVLVGSSGGSLRAMLNQGNGTFTSPTSIFTLATPPTALRCGDITGNGFADIVLVSAGAGGATDIVWSANSGAGLSPLNNIPSVYQGAPSSVLLIGDLDQEPGNDLVLQVPEGPLLALRNTLGDGTEWSAEPILFFPEFPFADPKLLDVDGDGFMDIVDASADALQWARSPLSDGTGWNSFTPQLIESGDGVGPGNFGKLGCGDECAVVYVPTDEALPLRWSGHLESASNFVYGNDLPAIDRPSLLILVDLDQDGRDDLVKVTANGISWHRALLEAPTLQIELPGLDTLCLFGPQWPLPAIEPSGGRWSGPGVVNDAVDRFQFFFQGTYTLTHTVYEPEGCPVAATTPLRLIDGPTVLPSLGAALCSGQDPIVMESQPANTTWDGLTNGNILDPAQLTEPFFACVFEDVTGSSCVTLVGPVLVWNTLPAEIGPVGPFCVNSGIQTIVPVAALPTGTTWEGSISGTGPGEAYFDPAQGPGEYVIIMTSNPVGPQQCANSDTVTVVVSDDIPDVSVDQLPGIYCATPDLIELQGATPAGGTWTGPGVDNAVMDPEIAGAGIHQVTYTVDGGNGCVGAASLLVQVADTVTLGWTVQDLEFCKYDDPAQFTASLPGGSWTQPVNDDGIFTPASVNVGSHPLLYTYTGPNGCTLQNSLLELLVLPSTEVSIDSVPALCIDHLPVLITGSPDGIWSGAVTGEGPSVLFDPAQVGIGTWPVILESQSPGECLGSAVVMVVVRSCAGIEEADGLLEARLAPNPFREGTFLLTAANGGLHVEVLDAAGRIVQQLSTAAGGDHTLPIDLRGQANGTYVVRVMHDGMVRHLRAVKLD